MEEVKHIRITWGTGTARTRLAAFDAALHDAGIANFNLIKLSSIIPRGWKIREERLSLDKNAAGKRLYVVLSSCIENRKGKTAVAGIGWSTDKKGDGVLIHLEGTTLSEVRMHIRTTFSDMKRYRKAAYTPLTIRTAHITCTKKPVCAQVVAVFKTEHW